MDNVFNNDPDIEFRGPDHPVTGSGDGKPAPDKNFLESLKES